MSAPNSSQGSRNHNLSSLRVPAKSGGNNTGIGAGNGGFEYGHDFFTGHWAESKPFVGAYDASLEDSSNANTGRDEAGGIFFMDGNTAMDSSGRQQQPRRGGQFLVRCLLYSRIRWLLDP
jgi:hypothetical protein